MKKPSEKRIVEVLERIGNEYAWIDRVKIDFHGKVVDTFTAGIPDGAHVLALLDDGKIPLVHQYRERGRGWTYELPGGIVEKTDSPEAAALRELEEEAGYVAKELEPLISFNNAPVMRTQVHIFIGRKVSKVKRRPEHAEQEMSVELVTPEQLYEMVFDGTIRDATTVIGTLAALQRGIIKLDRKKLPVKHPF